jgi:hypothetical protein
MQTKIDVKRDFKSAKIIGLIKNAWVEIKPIPKMR